MKATKKKYQEWCASIAESVDRDNLISHFREHVFEHYKRENNRETEKSLKNWMAGVLNFLTILEKKYPQITTEDKLFKLSKFYKKHKEINRDNHEGPAPTFDIKAYMKEYRGDME